MNACSDSSVPTSIGFGQREADDDNGTADVVCIISFLSDDERTEDGALIDTVLRRRLGSLGRRLSLFTRQPGKTSAPLCIGVQKSASLQRESNTRSELRSFYHHPTSVFFFAPSPHREQKPVSNVDRVALWRRRHCLIGEKKSPRRE